MECRDSRWKKLHLGTERDFEKPPLLVKFGCLNWNGEPNILGQLCSNAPGHLRSERRCGEGLTCKTGREHWALGIRQSNISGSVVWSWFIQWWPWNESWCQWSISLALPHKMHLQLKQQRNMCGFLFSERTTLDLRPPRLGIGEVSAKLPWDVTRRAVRWLVRSWVAPELLIIRSHFNLLWTVTGLPCYCSNLSHWQWSVLQRQASGQWSGLWWIMFVCKFFEDKIATVENQYPWYPWSFSYLPLRSSVPLGAATEGRKLVASKVDSQGHWGSVGWSGMCVRFNSYS